MPVWRICSRRFLAFDGQGARIHGGRWNFPGFPVVYTSASLSLAALELLVHVDPDSLPVGMVALSARIPEGIAIPAIEERGLPRNWNRYPAPDRLREMGTDWLRSRVSLALSVPSAVIPTERNYLLNRAHPDFHLLEISKPIVFLLDPRLAGPARAQRSRARKRSRKRQARKRRIAEAAAWKMWKRESVPSQAGSVPAKNASKGWVAARALM